MKKLIVGLLLNALIPIGSAGQNLKLIGATERRWAGGIAGRSGCNTDISIKSNGRIKIDSLYIKEYNNNLQGYALNTPCNGGWYLRADSLHHMYYISKNETHTERMYYNDNTEPFDTKLQTKKADSGKVHTIRCINLVSGTEVRQFNGYGLVTYFYKGKKQCLLVKQIKELPSVSYP